jgi:PAB1-binding protein PBP1
MAQQRKAAPGELSNGTTKMNREHASMSFQKRDVADIHVTGASLPPRSQNGTLHNFPVTRNITMLTIFTGNSSIFRTDAAISGNRFQSERPLKRWTPDENVDTDMSLESSRNKSSTGAGWDQFEANERLFGVKTDYDENIYTTAIDKSHPNYNKRYAEADRKAREIESSAAQNSHVAEERIVDNLNVDRSGQDEEDK